MCDVLLNLVVGDFGRMLLSLGLLASCILVGVIDLIDVMLCLVFSVCWW